MVEIMGFLTVPNAIRLEARVRNFGPHACVPVLKELLELRTRQQGQARKRPEAPKLEVDDKDVLMPEAPKFEVELGFPFENFLADG